MVSRRGFLVMGAAAVAVPGVAVLPPAGAAPESDPTGAIARSSHPIAENMNWRSYVLDPQTPTVGPREVYVEGDASAVTNPDGLKARGGQSTSIRATALSAPTVLGNLGVDGGAHAGAPRLILDLGLDVGGHVEVGVTAGSGATVRLAYAEARQFLAPGGDMVPGITLGRNDEPDGRYDTFVANGPMTFVSPGVRGAQRWILLQLDGSGTVSIDYVRVRVTQLRPSADDYVGRFLCSDDLVNKVWWGSAYSCNMATGRDERLGGNMLSMDAGKRDRLAWLGDLTVANVVAAYGVRQGRGIIRDTISTFSCQQYPDGYIAMASDIHVTCPAIPDAAVGPPASTAGSSPAITDIRLPEYTAWFVIVAYQYSFYSGDVEFIRAMLPVMRRAIGYYRRNLVDGLFTTQGGVFPINWHPFDPGLGQDAHTQAVWYRALHAMADAERWVGDGDTAEGLDAEAETLKQSTIQQLWDDAVGALRLNTLDLFRAHTYDAQAEGIYSGILDGPKAQRARSFIDATLMTRLGAKNSDVDNDPIMSQYISPYPAFSDMRARFRDGDAAGAMRLVRNLFGHMVTTDPAGTVWEKMNLDGSPQSYSLGGLGKGVFPEEWLFLGAGSTSLANPWSAGSLPALSENVAGLQPAAPGWSRWRIAPEVVDLRWAQGQVGTPSGVLAVRWERGAADTSFRLTVMAPARTSGEVAVPQLGHSRTIACDGRVVWRDGRPVGGAAAKLQGDAVVIAQGPGQSTFAW